MPTSADTAVGRVRWKRFAAIIVPGVVAAGALSFMTAEGAIAASFAVSGNSFKVSVDSLDGKGFEQFGAVDKSADGKTHPVQVSGIRSATIRNMCQSMVVPTPIGTLSVILHAGAPGGAPVEASNLVMDVASLSANAKFTNIQIGRDAATVNQVPGVTGAAGGFAQQATAVHLDHVQQTAWATTAGTFKLNGLRMSLQPGSHECF
jgi:hypothetical protein